MPTKEWLEQRTKIQAYLEPDLSVKLEAWMKDKNISQLSTAVTAILDHYLNDRPPSSISTQVLQSDVEMLKKEVAAIKASLVEAGAKSLAPKMITEAIVFPTEKMEIQYTEKEAADGLTKSELCDRIGLTIYQAEKAAKEQSMTGNDYLLKITGWQAGEGKRPRYYPAKD